MSFIEKQRHELIKANGQPKLTLEFDVFEGNKVSMWTHFDHSSDYRIAKEMLIAIKGHLEDFLKDGAMCSFHKNENTSK